MKIVIDTNILFSALIKDSLTRKILLQSNEEFLFPVGIFIEYERHKTEILEKANIDETEFNKLFSIILSKVHLIPKEKLEPFKTQAATIVKDIDQKDAIFIACALAHPGSILWSDDKALKRQNTVLVLSTSEIKEHFTPQ